MSYKSHFRRSLEADPDRVHFAAHSHHLWPDVSFDAHVEAWLDAARLADRKWEKVFGEVIPRAQGHVARLLSLSDAGSVAFAASTHQLLLRILSCLPRRLRVLTTDAEFHSFARQSARLEEDGDAQVTRIAAQPFASFADRFAEAAAKGPWDLVYLSHVFYSSGYAVDLEPIVSALASRDTFVVIDGYHAFCARPVNLSRFEHRVFYLGGGYKYAMTGEGACFVHAPPGYGERPRDTGWFAAFGALERVQTPGSVAYAKGGARFLGATFDPTPLYRFNAVLDWLARLNVTPAIIHAHAVRMQERFMQELIRDELDLHEGQLVVPLSEPSRGQFLTFETAGAADIHERLLRANVVTDVRGNRLRFGFGLYHDEEDISRGVERVGRAISTGRNPVHDRS